MADPYSQLYPWIDYGTDAQAQPQPFGILGTSGQGPLELTAQMGQHADWDKFLREARRSTNIEDNRALGEAYVKSRANRPLWQKILEGIMPGGDVDQALDYILYK